MTLTVNLEITYTTLHIHECKPHAHTAPEALFQLFKLVKNYVFVRIEALLFFICLLNEHYKIVRSLGIVVVTTLLD